MRRASPGLLLALGALVMPGSAGAGQSAATPATALPALVADAPPAPLPPEMITRNGGGHATVRAVQVTAPIRVDGRLDEDIYGSVAPISDFIQIDPRNGDPASQRTEVWLLFDRDNVYVSARCWESNPERMVANELRRDNFTIYSNNDAVTFIFDTFYNRRDGTLFVVTPIGGRFDGQYTNERQYNTDFNPIWDVSTGRFEGGWTLEAVIPFKSLRYPQEGPQVWGFKMMRNNRWRNELSSLTLLPPARAVNAITQSSRAATMVGLHAPARSKNIEIKPYVTGDLTTDLTTTPRTSNAARGDAGLDVKFGLTQGMTADVTYNPDFAQVEADEQQVNLTRFSLFFPEKRDFFLENQTLFTVGTTGPSQGAGDTPASSTRRSIAQSGVGRNDTLGVDGAFSFFTDFTIATCWARTRTEGRNGRDQSYRAQLDYTGDRYGVQMERLVVVPDFNPEVGFVRRGDMRRASASSATARGRRRLRRSGNSPLPRRSITSRMPPAAWRRAASSGSWPSSSRTATVSRSRTPTRSISPSELPHRTGIVLPVGVRIRQRGRHVHLRTAAGCRRRVGRARGFLQRSQDDGGRQPRPRQITTRSRWSRRSR